MFEDDLSWLDRILFNRLPGEYIETSIEMASDRYESGEIDTPDSFLDFFEKDLVSGFEHFIRRGILERQGDMEIFYEYNGHIPVHDINYRDMAVVLYNYLVDELDSPDDLPYQDI